MTHQKSAIEGSYSLSFLKNVYSIGTGNADMTIKKTQSGYDNTPTTPEAKKRKKDSSPPKKTLSKKLFVNSDSDDFQDDDGPSKTPQHSERSSSNRPDHEQIVNSQVNNDDDDFLDGPPRTRPRPDLEATLNHNVVTFTKARKGGEVVCMNGFR